MRRFLLLPVLGLAFAATAVPAQAQYLVQGCAAGDYRVIDVEAAGRELVEVCTDEDPLEKINYAFTCEICDKIKT